MMPCANTPHLIIKWPVKVYASFTLEVYLFMINIFITPKEHITADIVCPPEI